MVENPVIYPKSSVTIITNLDTSPTDIRNLRNLEILTEYPHPDSSIREPQDEFPAEEDAKLGNTPRIPLPHQKKINEYRKKKREDPDYRRDQAEKYHANYLEKKEKKRQEQEKAEKEFQQQYAEGKIGATETLGIIREQRLSKQETKENLEGLQGKGATPNKGKQPEVL
ncbi:Uncharacterized protein HZ326_28026 [Fusarium oxysporum f. sp. albedinis]|nr:Uncharacterized protein HZ326_28026 [Fusarium oxysporum f. sp. albedinis]